jgi:hypothetical protein
MVEIASDRPLFKTILVEMAYSVIHLHNRINKSRIAILLLCPEELELGKHLRCLPRWSKMQRKWEKRAACSFWTLRLIVPNSPITYNLSNFITDCRSLGDKIIEVLLYYKFIKNQNHFNHFFNIFAFLIHSDIHFFATYIH